MSSLKLHTEIERFLANELPADEHAAFEARMAGDAALAEEVELFQLANEAIADAEVLRLKAQLQQIHTAAQAGSGPSAGGTSAGWWLGAILLVCAPIAFFMYAAEDGHQQPDIEVASSKPKAEPATAGTNAAAAATQPQGAEQPSESGPKPETTYAASIGIEEALIPIETLITANETTFVAPRIELEPDALLETISIPDVVAPDPRQAESTASPNTDPCADVNKRELGFKINVPCFDNEFGWVEVDPRGIAAGFTTFSVDGGESFSSTSSTIDVNGGEDYTFVAKASDGCITKPVPFTVTYRHCNYVVQPSQFKYWELDLPPNEEYPIVLEIRNARTGTLVYQRQLDVGTFFEWNGTNQNGTTLPMGNYIYMFNRPNGDNIAKGQVAVIE